MGWIIYINIYSPLGDPMLFTQVPASLLKITSTAGGKRLGSSRVCWEGSCVMEAERQGWGGQEDPKGAMKRYLPLTSALLRTLNPQGAKVTTVGFGRMVILLFSNPPPKKYSS